MKKLILSFILTGCYLFTSLSAQSLRISTKEGEVSRQELEMSVYSLDTTATALVLYEKNLVCILAGARAALGKKIVVYERIKILKEEGKSRADYRFTYSSEADDGDMIDGIKVTTWNLDENGKIVKSKLQRKYIFKEKVTDGIEALSFSAPDVKVGSVIEVSYEYTSNRYWQIDDIGMQRTIPINLIDVAVGYPDFFYFTTLQRGFRQLIASRGSEFRPLDVGGYQTINYTYTTEAYRDFDVPALRNERFSYCPDQYRTALCYDLARISQAGVMDRVFSMKWDDVDKAYRDSRLVKECRAKPDKELSAAVKEAVGGLEDEKQVIAAVRSLVVNRVHWNEKRGLIPESASKVLKDGAGNAAAINALTASLLNSLDGYTADPALIRLRSEGILADFHVRPDAFNTFVLRITAPSGHIYYLDAARNDAYLNVLDPNYLITNARVIPSDGVGKGHFEDLTHMSRNMRIFNVYESIQEEGTLSGNAQLTAYCEDAYEIKELGHAYGEEEFRQKIEEGMPSVDIRSFETDFKDYLPTAQYSFTYDREYDDYGDLLYIKPFLRAFQSESDFQNPERRIPVDFPYPSAFSYNYFLTIPEGYVVEELPKNIRVNPTEGVGLRFLLMSKMTGTNQVNIQFSMNNDMTLLPAENYETFRAYWQQLCNIYQSTLVLKKI